MSTDFPTPEAPQTLTVSQLNRQARTLLESHFDFVWVTGEISNFAAPASGHWYFSLKDGDAQVRCAMFRNRNQRLRFRPGNGDAVRLRARVSLYEGRGEFQLIVEFAEPAGEGALQLAFEALKNRLQAEGLFAAERKQALPEHCSHLGIITSNTGAALQDILTVLERRWPAMAVTVLAVPVQGDGAAQAIAAAIGRANHLNASGELDLDALIVGRGGGSLEDLWAFNEEVVARAIAASTLPVVSAVGHETDFSIADLVADQRAPTPSAAAELLSPDQREWKARLSARADQLGRLMRAQLAATQAELSHLARRLRHPGHQLREQSQRLDDLDQRLSMAVRHRLRGERNHLALLSHRLQANAPAHRLESTRNLTQNLEQRLESAMQQRLLQAQQQLAHLASLLDSLSPLRTLERGFAIVSTEQGEIVRRTAQVSPGDRLNARLADGRLSLQVEAVETTEPAQPD